jgi:hypothetical protein
MPSQHMNTQQGWIILGYLLILGAVSVLTIAGIVVYKRAVSYQTAQLEPARNIAATNLSANALTPQASASYQTIDLEPTDSASAKSGLATTTEYLVQASTDPVPSDCILGDNCTLLNSTVVSPDQLAGKDAGFLFSASVDQTLTGMDSEISASLSYDGYIDISRLLGPNLFEQLSTLPIEHGISGKADLIASSTDYSMPQVLGARGDNIHVNQVVRVAFAAPAPGTFSLLLSALGVLYLTKRPDRKASRGKRGREKGVRALIAS